MPRKSNAEIVTGIEQNAEMVPAGYSYDPRREPKLVKLEEPDGAAVVAIKLRNDSYEGDS
jgi:hypothetical protein